MRGPFGVGRTAATRVLAAEAPRLMVGTAELGRRTRAFVRWKLGVGDGGTRVRLEATIERMGWLDRLLLVLGGRAWLERRFAAVLRRLTEDVSAEGLRSGSYGGSHRDAPATAPVRHERA